MTAAWPSEIRLASDKRTLHVTFESGESFALTAELLRVESPSAEIQGHSAGQKTTPSGKQNVAISEWNRSAIMPSVLSLTTAMIPACSAGISCMITGCARTA